jgi:hypothetical protein
MNEIVVHTQAFEVMKDKDVDAVDAILAVIAKRS